MVLNDTILTLYSPGKPEKARECQSSQRKVGNCNQLPAVKPAMMQWTCRNPISVCYLYLWQYWKQLSRYLHMSICIYPCAWWQQNE